MRKPFLFITMILLCIFILAGCNEKQEDSTKEEETTPTPVETTAIEFGDFYVEKSVYGHVAAEKQLPIMVEQPGEITTLKVENGEKVSKNDHLATIKTPIGHKAFYAPADGIVANLQVEEGAFQSNEDPLMLIIDTDHMTASFSVTSSIRDLLKKDKKVTLFIEDKKYDGKVLAMDPMPDESGQYPIKVTVENEDGKILPGGIVILTMKEQKAKDTFIVPSEAVVTGAEQQYVFIVEKDQARKVLVEVQETQSDKTAIKGDLEKEDEIIVSGQHTLSDGSTIEVKAGNDK